MFFLAIFPSRTPQLATAVLLFAAVLTGACAYPPGSSRASESVVGQPAPDLRESEDVSNRVLGARISNGKVVEFTATDIPKGAFSRMPVERTKEEKPPQSVTLEKIHPLLENWINTRPGSDIDTIVLNFLDDMRIPGFPEPATGEPRESATNKRALERANAIVRHVRARASRGV